MSDRRAIHVLAALAGLMEPKRDALECLVVAEAAIIRMELADERWQIRRRAEEAQEDRDADLIKKIVQGKVRAN